MKKLNKVAMLFASAALVAPISTTFAQPVDPARVDNWRNVDGQVWKERHPRAVLARQFLDARHRMQECDGALKAAAPAAPAAPAAAAPAAARRRRRLFRRARRSRTRPMHLRFRQGDAQARREGTAGRPGRQDQGHQPGSDHRRRPHDSVGTDAYNQKLSVRRAEAIKTYLVSKGMEANRVYTEGKGEKQPVADNKTADGRAKNRRVEIEVVGTRATGK
jgi:OOP family OmpA-OmpF porin